MAHIQKKIYMAISDEEYLKKMQDIVYTKQAKDIFSLIYNYKVELETDKKTEELEKVKELEEYLRNNEEGLLRYQYRLGYKEGEIEKYKEELVSRIPEPKVVKKRKENKIVYAGRYEIASNFTGSTKKYIIDLLKDKKCSELMLIN